MARIRTVKPEYFGHEELGACSRDARLLGIALMQLADSHGRFRWVPRQVLGHAFPWDDDITLARLEALAVELEGAGLIRRYEVDGRAICHFPNFGIHQRFSGKEAKAGSRLPPPGEAEVKNPALPGEAEGKHPTASPADSALNAGRNGEAEGKTSPLPGEAKVKRTGAQEQGTGNREQGRGTGESSPSSSAPPDPDVGERVHHLASQLGVLTPKPLQWPKWSAVAANPNHAEVTKLVEWAREKRYSEDAFLGCFDAKGRITAQRANRSRSRTPVYRNKPETGPTAAGHEAFAEFVREAEQQGGRS